MDEAGLEAGLEVFAGFLVEGAGVCPLVGEAVPWTPGGWGHVEGCV